MSGKPIRSPAQPATSDLSSPSELRSEDETGTSDGSRRVEARGRELAELGCELATADALDAETPARRRSTGVRRRLLPDPFHGAGRRRRLRRDGPAAARNFGRGRERGRDRADRSTWAGSASRRLEAPAEPPRDGARAAAARYPGHLRAGRRRRRRRQRVVPHVLYLVKRLPAMITPRWMATRTQPIAIEDVRRYQRRAAIEAAAGREIQIGGPEVTTYGGMMDALARALDRRPPLRRSVSAARAGPVVALDRARHPGRRRRRATPGRGPRHGDGNHRHERHGAVRDRARPARCGDARRARRGWRPGASGG